MLALTLQSHEVRDVNDFDGALARIGQQGPDFLSVLQDALTLQNRRRIIDFANQKRKYVCWEGMGRGRRSDVLRGQLARTVSARRILRG